MLPAVASQPVSTAGTADPALRSVKTAGQIVKGQALWTVKVRAVATAVKERTRYTAESMGIS